MIALLLEYIPVNAILYIRTVSFIFLTESKKSSECDFTEGENAMLDHKLCMRLSIGILQFREPPPPSTQGPIKFNSLSHAILNILP